MKQAVLVLGLIVLLGASPVFAHEVSASRVRVVPGDGAVEIWQTTPRQTARDVSARLTIAGGQIETDEQILGGMAQGWKVSSETGGCKLTRQAHRRTHHETQLQLRYLFDCPPGSQPSQLFMPWLMQTPEDHFIILELETQNGIRTRILERENVIVRIAAPTRY